MSRASTTGAGGGRARLLRRPRLRLAGVCLSLVLLPAILAAYRAPGTYGCGTFPRGALVVAETTTPAAVWYDAEHPPPPLTDEITEIARNLAPGSSASMVAYVRNNGRSAGTPSISIEDLVDSGGPWTPAERVLEPTSDAGDLSAAIRIAISYTSSLRPSATYLVASGSLRELAAGSRDFSAPVRLLPYSCLLPDTGTWRISLSVPRSADDRTQGDECSCTVSFGLVQARAGRGR